MKLAAIFQMLACTVALVACLCLPSRNETALLIPMGSTRVLDALDSGSRGNVAIVGSGRISGSLAVRLPDSFPISALLRQGIIPLAAPAYLCGGTVPADPPLPVQDESQS